MHEGRRRSNRETVLAQSTMVSLLLFGGIDEQQAEEFINTGYIDGSEPRENVEPYDPEAMRAAVRTGMLGQVRDA